jgi:hypothetical protein
MLGYSELPWTCGDCSYSLIGGSDLERFLEECANEDECPDLCLAMQYIKTLPEDVLIDLES